MDGRILYVCTLCAEMNPESCGRFDPKDLRIMPNGFWMCEDCADETSNLQNCGVIPRGKGKDEWPLFSEFQSPYDIEAALLAAEEMADAVKRLMERSSHCGAPIPTDSDLEPHQESIFAGNLQDAINVRVALSIFCRATGGE